MLLPLFLFQSKKVLGESLNTNKNIVYGHYLEYSMKKKSRTFFVWRDNETPFDIVLSNSDFFWSSKNGYILRSLRKLWNVFK